MVRRAAIFLLVLLALWGGGGCASGPAGGRDRAASGFQAGHFRAEQLAKTDIDRVAEAHRRELFIGLRLLAEKLYRRNPREWQKDRWSQAEAPLERLFGKPHNWRFPELEGRYGSEAILWGFRESYTGDRVFALMAGLGGMVNAAFDGKTEFFMTDDLDPQKLYNAARNVEIAVWKLSHDKAADGSLLLLSNDPGPPANLSFEREFGKIVGSLDLLSGIIADKSNRTVTKVVQNMATAVFLPIVAIK